MRSVRSITALASLTFLTAWDARAASGDDAELARSARVETILRVALERNPDLAENQARARAAEARSDAASRLPDLEAKYEQWGVPLPRPYALDEAQMLMLGLRQTFPAWGSLDARGRAAAEEAGSAQDAARARRQDVAAQVRRTYVAYYRSRPGAAAAPRARRADVAHPRARAAQSAHRARQAAGRPPAGAGADAAPHRRRADRARAAIQPGAAERAHGPARGRAAGPARGFCRSRPGRTSRRWNGASTRTDPRCAAGARNIRRDEALVDGARRSGRFPQLMVGLDYWYMPTFPSDMRHAYGAMVAINLPWLSGRHARRAARGGGDAAGRAARARVDAEHRPLRAARRGRARRFGPPVVQHHRPGPAGAGEAQPRGDAGRVRRRPGRRGRAARRAPVVPAGPDRARARAGGAGRRARRISNAPPGVLAAQGGKR